jgi:hypothetical protein
MTTQPKEQRHQKVEELSAADGRKYIFTYPGLKTWDEKEELEFWREDGREDGRVEGWKGGRDSL